MNSLKEKLPFSLFCLSLCVGANSSAVIGLQWYVNNGTSPFRWLFFLSFFVSFFLSFFQFFNLFGFLSYFLTFCFLYVCLSPFISSSFFFWSFSVIAVSIFAKQTLVCQDYLAVSSIFGLGRIIPFVDHWLGLNYFQGLSILETVDTDISWVL